MALLDAENYFLHAKRGYTGGISGAMGFCCKRGNDGCGEDQGSKPLEGCHCESSSAGLAEGTLGGVALLGLDGAVIKFSALIRVA
jgi:hypothetical protein